jgi:eukaryotic-like serine/threonine-protein kinase
MWNHEPWQRACPQCGASLGDAAHGLRLRCLVELGVTLNRAADQSSPADWGAFGEDHARLFGDYQLLEEIARGGMGVVYKARHISLNRIVALKMLPAGLFAQAESVRRFYAEAKSIAQLQHPNIVAIHEIGEQDGQPYFTMDYGRGGP